MVAGHGKSDRFKAGSFCSGYEDAVFDLLDGRVGPIQAPRLTCHLADCETCRLLFRALVRTDALLRELFASRS